jgi:hypothetical protein
MNRRPLARTNFNKSDNLRLETNPGAIHQDICLCRARKYTNHLAIG